jgi:hypothetical protein
MDSKNGLAMSWTIRNLPYLHAKQGAFSDCTTFNHYRCHSSFPTYKTQNRKSRIVEGFRVLWQILVYVSSLTENNLLSINEGL